MASDVNSWAARETRYSFPWLRRGDGRAYFEGVAVGDRETPEVFDEFRKRMVEAIGKEWVPVYRIGDGEFRAIREWAPGGGLGWEGKAVSLLRRLLGRPTTRTMWGEMYSAHEAARAGSVLFSALREVAASGYLAVLLELRGENALRGSQAVAVLERENILLTERTYLPFYSVLGLLTSPLREMFRGRRVAVVWGRDDGTRWRAAASLKRLGAAKVIDVPISPRRSLLEAGRLEERVGDAEVAIVGAGIGAAAVVCEMRKMRGPVIDAGAFLDYLADPGNVMPHGCRAVGLEGLLCQ